VLSVASPIALQFPLPVQGLGASWEVEGLGERWKVFEKSVFKISLTKTSMIIYTSPSVPLTSSESSQEDLQALRLEGRGKIII
jgi:hypothetical protein